MEVKRWERWNNQSSYDFFMEQWYDKNIKILEIWCNLGTLLSMIYDTWYKNIKWIDVNSEWISIWKEKHKNISDNIYLCDWVDIPFLDNEFDLVISFDVLEHIPDVNKHLSEVKRVLKQWWLYIWQTPNKIINIPWEIWNKKSFSKWKVYHCSLQTLNSLKSIFRKNWFEEIFIKKRNLLNSYNIQKVKNKLWYLWFILLSIVNKMPLILQTNFWFSFKKK